MHKLLPTLPHAVSCFLHLRLWPAAAMSARARSQAEVAEAAELIRTARFASRSSVTPPKKEDVQEELDVDRPGYEAHARQVAARSARPRMWRSKKLGVAIKASVELAPTLVVWIVDRTPSARRS